MEIEQLNPKTAGESVLTRASIFHLSPVEVYPKFLVRMAYCMKLNYSSSINMVACDHREYHTKLVVVLLVGMDFIGILPTTQGGQS